MARENFYVVRNPNTGDVREDRARKPRRSKIWVSDRLASSSSAESETGRRGWVLTVVFLLLFLLSIILLIVIATKMSRLQQENSRLQDKAKLLEKKILRYREQVSRNVSTITDLSYKTGENVSNMLKEITDIQNHTTQSLDAFNTTLKNSLLTLLVSFLESFTLDNKGAPQARGDPGHDLNCSALLAKICPEGWRLWKLHACYYFSLEKKTWEEAQRDCRSRQAHLVILQDEGEQSFVSGNSKDTVWIGLNDTAKEGTWVWVDDFGILVNQITVVVKKTVLSFLQLWPNGTILPAQWSGSTSARSPCPDLASCRGWRPAGPGVLRDQRTSGPKRLLCVQILELQGRPISWAAPAVAVAWVLRCRHKAGGQRDCCDAASRNARRAACCPRAVCLCPCSAVCQQHPPPPPPHGPAR
nr:PREDICTED: CD209 antigen-like protein B isoform X1 [Lepisosteus oculatus]